MTGNIENAAAILALALMIALFYGDPDIHCSIVGDCDVLVDGDE